MYGNHSDERPDLNCKMPNMKSKKQENPIKTKEMGIPSSDSPLTCDESDGLM